MKHTNYTITIEDAEGNKVVYGPIDSRDLNLTLTNDLAESVNFLGRMRPARLVSRGTSIELSAYIKNKNFDKDFAEATEENAKEVGK